MAQDFASRQGVAVACEILGSGSYEWEQTGRGLVDASAWLEKRSYGYLV